jgi:hypothetical protein
MERNAEHDNAPGIMARESDSLRDLTSGCCKEHCSSSIITSFFVVLKGNYSLILIFSLDEN